MQTTVPIASQITPLLMAAASVHLNNIKVTTVALIVLQLV
jgi:hypothetical protein